MTLIFSDACDLRRGERDAERRLDDEGERGVALAQALERGGRVAVGGSPSAVEQRARLVGEVEGRLLAHALDERRELEQRVVADLRHRRVAGDALGGDREAEHALLGAADRVDAALRRPG